MLDMVENTFHMTRKTTAVNFQTTLNEVVYSIFEG